MGTTFLRVSVLRTSNIFVVSVLGSCVVSEPFVGLLAFVVVADCGLLSVDANSAVGAAFRSGVLDGLVTSACALLVRGDLPAVDFTLAIFEYSSHVPGFRNELNLLN